MPNKTVITQDLPVYTTNRGIADIVGFGQNGVIILRNSLNTQAVKVVNNFSIAQGWDVKKHPRLLAATTNSVPGTSDIVGFGNEGVYISVNKGDNSFADPVLVIRDFGENNTWRVGKHIRYMADLRKTGRADIIGFGDGGVYVSKNNGAGNFGPIQKVVSRWGYDDTWRLDRHLRFLGDVTGDGYLDIVGFGENWIYLGQSDTFGGFGDPKEVLANFTPGQGWAIDKHPRFVADLTGDGTVDILGFGNEGVYVSLNNGSGGFGVVNRVVDSFGYSDSASAWRVDKHPRFVADLTGNGVGDIVGFGWDAVWVSFNNGNGTFQGPKKVLSGFGYNQGWKVEKHPRFVVDLTGDGRADIIGFGEDGVYVAFNDGKGGFAAPTKLTSEFGFNDGQWAMDKTVRWPANLYQ